MDKAGAGTPLAGGSSVITIYTTGLANYNAFSKTIHLSPNPATKEVDLKSSTSGLVKYRVLDLLGKEIMSGEFYSSITLNTSSLSAGSYIVSLEVGAQFTYKKLVLENK
ncbi:hypothetical protein CNR22_06455 [Sphingobacteriaceae bacterium]|nr:hypothetical protein CNR22_06455 [Sphingobacteriaceae bacterium]